MKFNLTPTILVDPTPEAVEEALEALTAAGTDLEWVETLRKRTDAHTGRTALVRRLTCVHGTLTAACHDASCAPPPHGTGGSRKKGGVTPGFTIKPTPKRTTPWVTEHNIRALLNDPALTGLRRDDIHDRHIEQAGKQRESDLWFVRRGMGMEDDGTKRGTGDWERSGMRSITLERKPEKRDVLTDDVEGFRRRHEAFEMMNKIKEKSDVLRIMAHSKDYTADSFTEHERPLYEAIQRRIRSDDPYETIRVETEFGAVVIKGIEKQGYGPQALITDETEAAVRNVGHAIRDEISVRMLHAVDIDAEKTKWKDTALEVERMLREVAPEITVGVDVTWGRFGGDLVLQIPTGLRSAVPGVPRDHPVRQQVEALIRERNVLQHRWEDQALFVAAKAHKDVVTDVLSSVRSMGGELSGTPRQAKVRGFGRSSRDQVVEAVKAFPTDWIEASNTLHHPVGFRQTKGRAHYQDDARKRSRYGLTSDLDPIKAEVTLDGSHGTAVHELAHRMEYSVPGVRSLEQRFYERRTEGLELKPLGKGYGSKEFAIEDGFFSAYVGKTYGGRAFEVMSMGTEALQSVMTWSKVDPDYQAFVLGTLATVYR